jgi:hypothetical protein
MIDVTAERKALLILHEEFIQRRGAESIPPPTNPESPGASPASDQCGPVPTAFASQACVTTTVTTATTTMTMTTTSGLELSY